MFGIDTQKLDEFWRLFDASNASEERRKAWQLWTFIGQNVHPWYGELTRRANSEGIAWSTKLHHESQMNPSVTLHLKDLTPQQYENLSRLARDVYPKLSRAYYSAETTDIVSILPRTPSPAPTGGTSGQRLREKVHNQREAIRGLEAKLEGLLAAARATDKGELGYRVYNPNGSRPRVVHQSAAEADLEASRLSLKENAPIEVLQIVARWTPAGELLATQAPELIVPDPEVELKVDDTPR